MTKKKTPQTMDKAPALTKLKTGACSMSRRCLSPPKDYKADAGCTRTPPSELGGFLKRLANRNWNSSAFHTILCAFAPIYARTTVFAA